MASYMNPTRPGQSGKKMGRLYYVIGASGVGKDSLLRYARPFLNDAPVLFAHRYITRPVELKGENHVLLSESEFIKRVRYDCFLFHWQSHGLRYGVGQEVQNWLEKGLSVVVNGSRGYLAEASEQMPEIIPILITVSRDKLKERLEQRGRENAEQITERLQRASQFDGLTHPNLIEVNNDGELKVAGQSLVKIFQD